jgi:competence protein ComEA
MLYQASAKERWGIVALVVLAAGALGWYGSGYSSPAAALDLDGGADFDVHVAGAVRYPKVIRAQPGKIVQDAIAAAGGATVEADISLINLAAPLLPNSRVYVPFTGEEDLAKLGPYGPASASTVPAAEQIDLNTATAQDFERLPGIGPAMAAEIVRYRASIGRFSALEQLIDVRGIGPKTFQKLRPYVKL